MKQEESRIFTVKEQLRNIYNGSRGFVLLRYFKKHKAMTKQLKERIMLAITEVNGCAMCSYVHTKIALSSGMSREEIKLILDGDSSNIPLNEAVAVLFGQDYAASKEHPSNESIERIIEEYGPNKAELILAACHMITMTNGMGISLDNLYKRIKLHRNKQSNIVSEISNPFLTMLLFPLLVFYFGVKCFFRLKPKLLKPQYSN